MTVAAAHSGNCAFQLLKLEPFDFFQVCCQIESFGVSPAHSQTMRSCTPASVSLAESPAKRRGVKQHDTI